jgi:hypothetical protein
MNHSSHAVMATIPNKRRRSKVISRQNEVPRHEALQRIQSAQQALRDYRQDLYPLGNPAHFFELSRISIKAQTAHLFCLFIFLLVSLFVVI